MVDPKKETDHEIPTVSGSRKPEWDLVFKNMWLCNVIVLEKRKFLFIWMLSRKTYILGS